MAGRPLSLLTAAFSVAFMLPASASAAPREVTLQASATEVTYGETVTFTGQITASEGTPSSCVAGATVIIRAMGPIDVVPGPPPTSWGEVGRTTSDMTGAFTFTTSPRSSASWAAHLPAEDSANCDEAVSNRLFVNVRLLVELTVRDRRVPRGEDVRFTVRVQPYCSSFDEDVALERRRSGEFVTVSEGESAKEEPCIVRFRQRMRRAAVYRASSGPNCQIVCPHEEGTSRSIRVEPEKG